MSQALISPTGRYTCTGIFYYDEKEGRHLRQVEITCESDGRLRPHGGKLLALGGVRILDIGTTSPVLCVLSLN